jgi:hypothetical protein
MKSYIFYSNNCVHSVNLIKLIESENLQNDFNLIELEKNKDKIPSYIKKVPTIIGPNLAKPLIGIECINWITNRKYFNQTTNNISNNNVVHIYIKPALDGLEFNKKESNAISDSYAGLDDSEFDKKMMNFNSISDNSPITNHIKTKTKSNTEITTLTTTVSNNSYRQPITNNKLKELILARKNQLNK